MVTVISFYLNCFPFKLLLSCQENVLEMVVTS